MQKWEYKTFQFKVEESNEKEGSFFSLRGTNYLRDLKDGSDTELAKLGSEGWELVSVIPVAGPGIGAGTQNAIAFFKRAQ